MMLTFIKTRYNSTNKRILEREVIEGLTFNAVLNKVRDLEKQSKERAKGEFIIIHEFGSILFAKEYDNITRKETTLIEVRNL